MTGFYRPNAFAGQDPAVYNRELRHKQVWKNMLQRCNNPNATNYKDYGGRGVTVCDRWDPTKGGSYENFISDMGYRPNDRHHLDKEAVNPHNKVYCPEFCRWEHRKINQSAERKRPRSKNQTRKLKIDPRLLIPYPEDANPFEPDPRFRID